VTRELEIRLILGYSGLVDRHAVNWRPGWQRLANNFQPYPNGALCALCGDYFLARQAIVREQE
jgi:hypothetical protein